MASDKSPPIDKQWLSIKSSPLKSGLRSQSLMNIPRTEDDTDGSGALSHATRIKHRLSGLPASVPNSLQRTTNCSSSTLGRDARGLGDYQAALLTDSNVPLAAGLPNSRALPRIPHIPRPMRALAMFESVKHGLYEFVDSTDKKLLLFGRLEEVDATELQDALYLQSFRARLQRRLYMIETLQEDYEYLLQLRDECRSRGIPSSLHPDEISSPARRSFNVTVNRSHIPSSQTLPTMSSLYPTAEASLSTQSPTSSPGDPSLTSSTSSVLVRDPSARPAGRRVFSNFNYKALCSVLCSVEAQLEYFSGTLKCELAGMSGFARLSPDMQVEVRLRYGSIQRGVTAPEWRYKGRINKDGSQEWNGSGHVISPTIGDLLKIKAMEVKMLGFTTVLGKKYCEIRDLISPERRVLTVWINNMGTLKLSMVAEWCPLADGMDERMIFYNPFEGGFPSKFSMPSSYRYSAPPDMLTHAKNMQDALLSGKTLNDSLHHIVEEDNVSPNLTAFLVQSEPSNQTQSDEPSHPDKKTQSTPKHSPLPHILVPGGSIGGHIREYDTVNANSITPVKEEPEIELVIEQETTKITTSTEKLVVDAASLLEEHNMNDIHLSNVENGHMGDANTLANSVFEMVRDLVEGLEDLRGQYSELGELEESLGELERCLNRGVDASMSGVDASMSGVDASMSGEKEGGVGSVSGEMAVDAAFDFLDDEDCVEDVTLHLDDCGASSMMNNNQQSSPLTFTPEAYDSLRLHLSACQRYMATITSAGLLKTKELRAVEGLKIQGYYLRSTLHYARTISHTQFSDFLKKLLPDATVRDIWTETVRRQSADSKTNLECHTLVVDANLLRNEVTRVFSTSISKKLLREDCMADVLDTFISRLLDNSSNSSTVPDRVTMFHFSHFTSTIPLFTILMDICDEVIIRRSLLSSDPVVLMAFLKDLSYLPQPCWPQLCTLLSHSNSRVQSLAKKKVEQLVNVSPFSKALNTNNNNDYRTSYVENDSEPSMDHRASSYSSSISSRATAVVSLVEGLESDSPLIRCACCRGLAVISAQEATSQLVHLALGDSIPRVRDAAKDTLHRLGPRAKAIFEAAQLSQQGFQGLTLQSNSSSKLPIFNGVHSWNYRHNIEETEIIHL